VAYRIEAMTLNDLQGHSPTASLLKMWFYVQLCSSWYDFTWRM